MPRPSDTRLECGALLAATSQAVLEVLAGHRRGALATVVKASGSTPQRAGARLLLRPDGSTLGTVGGGAFEQAVLAALRDCIVDGEARNVSLELGYDLGMCCGGRMEAFVEPIDPPPRLVLFGAGHVARPTAELARKVGFRVVVVDEREELLTEERFPACERVLNDPRAALATLGLGDRDWVLVLTHDHQLDEQTLERVAAGPHRYVGMIGSRRKVFRVLQRLRARGTLPSSLERLHAPVGLDLGSETPEEIAVSIVAELVALRRGRPANHLRAVDDPRAGLHPDELPTSAEIT